VDRRPFHWRSLRLLADATRQHKPVDAALTLHTRATMPERHATPLSPVPPDPVSRVTLRPVVRAVPRPKTSIDIMNERDAFRARVDELEAALRTVQRETELAFRYSEIQLLTMCRIACVARRAVGEESDGSE